MKVKSEVEIDTSKVPLDYEYLGERPAEELLDNDYVWISGYVLLEAMKWKSEYCVCAPLCHVWRKRNPTRVVLEQCEPEKADPGLSLGTFLTGEYTLTGIRLGFHDQDYLDKHSYCKPFRVISQCNP